jgi:hypothetical protein
MTTSYRTLITALTTNPIIFLIPLLTLTAASTPCHAGQLTISRDALERTLRQQLFGGPK